VGVSELWTPPGARPARWARLRAGSKKLSDGRVLYDMGPFQNAFVQGGRWFETDDGQRVIASEDPTSAFGPLLHVSTSRRDRDPTWDEIRMVRDAFFGDDIDAMMVLPRAEDYVNFHPHTFHLWQTPVVWGMQ
jgi:hypothetical protein